MKSGMKPDTFTLWHHTSHTSVLLLSSPLLSPPLLSSPLLSSPLLASHRLASPRLSSAQGGHHEKWQEGISTYLGPNFVLIVQVHLWEMGLFVFVHRTLHPFVNNVQRTTEVRLNVCV